MKPIKPHSTADIINGRQCMEILHIASKTLFVCMRRRGDIPFHTYGKGRSKRVFYYRSEIEALLRPAHLNLPSNSKAHSESINTETMSSLQIAELTGKQHKSILRDIRILLEQGVTQHNFVPSEYKDATGRTLPCYNLTKKGCLILASGYNAILREKIIDFVENPEKTDETTCNPTYQQEGKTDIQIFKNSTFGNVRATLIDNEPYFIAKDVCNVLQLTDVSKSVERLDEDEKLIRKVFVSGQNREVIMVNESGLYNLIFRSNKSEAKAFRKWVTSEVLPSIRKTGTYTTALPRTYAEALRQLADTVEAKTTIREIPNPIKTSGTAIVPTAYPCRVSRMAQILQECGIRIGRNSLFAWLRTNGYLYMQGDDYNLPTPKAVQMGLFEVKHTVIDKPDGNIAIASVVKVTAAGQLHFLEQFLGNKVS